MAQLDGVDIGEGRQFSEFQFSDCEGEGRVLQIDVDCLETLTGAFRQAFISASMEARRVSNRIPGQEWVSYPRTGLNDPVDVGVDVMTGRAVPALLLATPVKKRPGMPAQNRHASPVGNARALAHETLARAGEARGHDRA